MEIIDYRSLCRLEPEPDQIIGTETLIKWDDPAVGRIYPGCFALFDEPGKGKSKQVIDAFCYLYLTGQIDKVLIYAPSGVVSVWFGEQLDELRKHLWITVSARVTRFSERRQMWLWGTSNTAKPLDIVITNYELIRKDTRLKEILPFADRRTVLIVDESSEVKNFNADQTKATIATRQKCGRVWILNGTPIELHPGDLFSQFYILDPRILGHRSWFTFRAHFAEMGGFEVRGRPQQIVGWKHLDELQAKTKPYILRRLKPVGKLPPKEREVVLTPETWKLYKEMKYESIAWLSRCSSSQAPQAITKVMRLAQITSGHLGGIQTFDPIERPEFLGGGVIAEDSAPVRFIGREKLDVLIQLYRERLTRDPYHKTNVWFAFAPSLQRALVELRHEFPTTIVEAICGGQLTNTKGRADRQRALEALDPRTSPADRSVLVLGNPAAGGRGLTFTACSDVIHESKTRRTGQLIQTEDRNDRIGQERLVSYTTLLAVGPKGQRTIDHIIAESHEEHIDLATFTASAWIKKLDATDD